MELLRDKSVLNLIEELRGKLRRKGIEDKTIPRFVFICGEQILDDEGKLIDKNILEEKNNIRYFIMKSFSKQKHIGEYDKESYPVKCVISEYLYSEDRWDDILTFEEVLAEISEYIIIITESPGTYCELGAFAFNDSFANKTIVINEDNPEYKNSFITKGPIRKIETQHEENIILYTGKANLKSSLQLNDLITKISTKQVKYTPNLDPQKLGLKNLIYELLNIIELFQPINTYEIESLYKEIKKISYYTISNRDKHKIRSFKLVIELMEKMKVIKNINGFYHLNEGITCYNAMFAINRKYLNAFRTKYLCRVYKCEPDRMRTC